jgi:hypothetical protein
MVKQWNDDEIRLILSKINEWFSSTNIKMIFTSRKNFLEEIGIRFLPNIREIVEVSDFDEVKIRSFINNFQTDYKNA